MLPEVVGWQRSTIFTILLNHFIRVKSCTWQFQGKQEVWEVVVPALPLCLCFGALPDRPPRLRLLQGGSSDQDQDSAAWGWRGGIFSYLKLFFTSLSVLQITCNCSALSKGNLTLNIVYPAVLQGLQLWSKRAITFLRPSLAIQQNAENSLVISFETESSSFLLKHSTASMGSSPMGIFESCKNRASSSC